MSDDADGQSNDLPSPEDGYREPPDETKRRNLITAAVIVALLLAWILYGLRKPLFG